jgi:hypothetical protein
MIKDPRYIHAKREVRTIKALYIHGLVYICVMSALAVLNMLLTNSGWWFQWPLIGWGIGLIIHSFLVFAPMRPFDHDWEGRRIKERLERE